MSASLTITPAASQPTTSVIKDSATNANKADGSAMDSLFATLLALAGKAQSTGNGTAPAVGGSSQYVQALNLDPTLGEDGEKTDATGDLLDMLDKLMAALEEFKANGEGDDKSDDAIAGLNAAADLLLSLLQPQKSGETIAIGTNGQINPDLKDKLQGLADLLKSLPKVGDQTAASANADASPDFDALMKKLDQLAERIEQQIQRPTAQAQAAAAQTDGDATSDATKTVATALSEKDVTGKTNAQQSTANNTPVADTQTKTDSVRPALDTDADMDVSTKKPDTTPVTHDKADKPNPAVTAGLAAAIKTEASTDSAKPDPLAVLQNHNASNRVDLAAAAKPATVAYQAPTAQVNLPTLAFQMVRQFQEGASRFEIRLDPPEMGKIDVKMDMDGKGGVHARLTVERAETLDMLQRDARGLERALQQAGLDSSKTSLEFSLKQNPFAQQNNQQQQGQDFANSLFDNPEGEEQANPATTAQVTQYRGIATPSGVNLIA